MIEPNFSAPVEVNPITACHVGAVEDEKRLQRESPSIFERGVQVLVPYDDDPIVLSKPVRTLPEAQGHVIRPK